MKATISFMTIDSIYTAEIPSALDPAPDGGAAWNYEGDRFITYTPAARYAGRDPNEFTLAFELEREGIKVSTYERKYAPPLRSAVWQLPDGYLNTFVAAPLPVTPEMMATVINAITVETATELPVPSVSFASPLARSDPRGPESMNELYFLPAGSLWWPYVKFTESPGATTGSAMVQRDASGGIRAWKTAAPGLVVSCAGPEEERQTIVDLRDQVANSVQSGAAIA